MFERGLRFMYEENNECTDVEYSLTEPSRAYNINFKTSDKHGYVTELIGDEYKQWDDLHPVFLHAGTGKGKNTFILKKIVKAADDKRCNVLYLVNRVALNTQQQKLFKNEINERRIDLALFDQARGVCSLNNENYLEYGNVFIMSYQSALGHLRRLNGLKTFHKIRNIDYIVFDECDFFVSDAEFNGNVGYILDQLMSFIKENCKSTKRIYMSATMDSVFPILYGKEKALFKQIKPDYMADNDFNPWYYYFPQNYDNHNFYVFEDWDLIKDLIDETEDQKFLCFVKRSEDGKNFADCLNNIWEGTDRKAVFINRKERENYDAYSQIVAYETFDEDVVFTTMLLDRGINITTEGKRKVTNVVIDSFFDEAEIKQMVGRLRVSKNPINVYLKSTNQNDLDYQKHLLDEKIKIIDSFTRVESLYKQIELIKRFDIPYYCTVDRQILVHNLNLSVIEQKLRLLYLYEKAVVDKQAQLTFPFSIERYMEYISGAAEKNAVIKTAGYKGIKVISKRYYDNLTYFDTYDKVILSWFAKNEAEKISLFGDKDKKKWEDFFECIAIAKHTKNCTDDTNNPILKKDYYEKYSNMGYCGFKKESNVNIMVEKLKEQGLIKASKVFYKNSAIFEFFETVIKHYNLNYKNECDSVYTGEVKIKKGKEEKLRKDFLFITRL